MSRIFLALLLTLATALPALSAPPSRSGGGGGSGYRGGGGHNGGHHHHGGNRWVVGVNFGYGGFPYWGGYYPWYPAAYYPYYPYYPAGYYPVQYVPQQPTTYVEQPAPQAQPQSPSGYWYYCADPGAYYPYIKECPAGWQRVAPQPSN